MNFPEEKQRFSPPQYQKLIKKSYENIYGLNLVAILIDEFLKVLTTKNMIGFWIWFQSVNFHFYSKYFKKEILRKYCFKEKCIFQKNQILAAIKKEVPGLETRRISAIINDFLKNCNDSEISNL